MATAPLTAKTLRDMVDSRTETLTFNFHKILEELKVDTQKRNNRTDITSTMDRAFQMDFETIQMIRASEDLIRTIRQMQEMWLFGKLEPFEEKDSENKETDIVDLASEVIESAVKRRHEQSKKG